MSISCYEYLSILEVGDKEEAPKDVTQNEYMEVLENVRGEIAKNHAEELAKTLNDASSAKTLKSLIMRYAAEYMSGKDYDRDELVEKIYQDMAGLGILTQYLYDPVVEEININSYDMIEVIYPNRTDFITGKDAFPTPEAALDIVKRMVRMGGKIIDAQTPQVDSFIGDGTRINATIPPIVPEDRGVVASIRKQNRNRISREMLENAGTASADELDFLTYCLCNRVSVGLAGGTGSGKTTVESFLLNEYILRNEDYNNRVYTIEDTQELNLLKYDDIHDRPARVVTMLTQETPVKITMMDLTKGALRYHPALIVPAEVRDGTVLQAVAAGQSGHTILTSFHADGAKDGYRRLVSLCHMADTTLTDEMLMEECVGSWPILVFAKQLKDKARKIMEIFEATGQKDGHVMLISKATNGSGILQEKYITVSVIKKDIEEARAYFTLISADLKAHFTALGSKCEELDASEKLRILHDFYRPGEENYFRFDTQELMRYGHDFKDHICPDSAEKHSDYLKLGEKYCRVLFLKDYASYIKDSMISEITSLNRNMMLSIDVVPVPTDEAMREVETRLLGVETNITNWQRRQNSNNNFSAVVPYDMEMQRKEAKEFLNDLTTRDQRMMLAVITLVLTADTKQQLNNDTEAILSTARKHMCQIATLKYQQLDGLNTVLPVGTRKINAFRTLTTESTAVFMPFKVQEIQDRGGIYFGENAISHNLIMCNKENLLNQSAFLLGVPGSGKSFSAKELITFLILNTEDDVLICDPEGEYSQLVEAMGDVGTVIHVSAGGKDRLNAMYMVDGYGENDPIVVKSEFIMSLIEQIDGQGVGPQHKSIIDRCIKAIYRETKGTAFEPTLCTLREKLLQQPEPEAKQIALALELYTTGSLDIFGHNTNVKLDRRIISFDIHGLGAQLKAAGLLVITDTMLNRVTLNAKKGKRTHIFIDEFHVLFENEYSAMFFNSAWRQFRKRNAFPTAITQNVEYLLDSVQASTMLSNSEFVIMLNQAASDRAKLAELLNISNEQLSYITNADPGCGLIKYGGSLVPFVNRFPKDTELYKLMTTNPNDKSQI